MIEFVIKTWKRTLVGALIPVWVRKRTAMSSAPVENQKNELWHTYF